VKEHTHVEHTCADRSVTIILSITSQELKQHTNPDVNGQSLLVQYTAVISKRLGQPYLNASSKNYTYIHKRAGIEIKLNARHIPERCLTVSVSVTFG
jgi:hypothetical protein